jgi:hypothetical protein
MGKNIWQEMGANNGAPRGGEGERLWASEKTEQFLSNPNQTTINKSIKVAELSRETYQVQMTTHASLFVDQENYKHFQPRMSLNTKGITAAANSRIDQK